jgi:hypothetical protein
MLRTRLSDIGQIDRLQDMKLSESSLNAHLNTIRITLPRLDTRDFVTGQCPVSIEHWFMSQPVLRIKQLTLAQRFRFVKGDPERNLAH